MKGEGCHIYFIINFILVCSLLQCRVCSAVDVVGAWGGTDLDLAVYICVCRILYLSNLLH